MNIFPVIRGSHQFSYTYLSNAAWHLQLSYAQQDNFLLNLAWRLAVRVTKKKRILHKHMSYLWKIKYLECSFQFSCSVVSDSLRPHELQHARPPCPSQTPRVYSNTCPSSQWCHPAISSSVVPFSSCPRFSITFSLKYGRGENSQLRNFEEYWVNNKYNSFQ